MPRDMRGRVERLIAAAGKMKRRLETDSKNPLVPVWQAKMAEYELSLTRIKAGLPEGGLTGNPVGVEVDVPPDMFKIEAQTPGN